MTGHSLHSVPVPVVYYVYWVTLIAVMVLGLAYWALRTKTGAGSKSKWLAGLVVLLICLLYGILQLPVLHTHFDVAAGKFVAGYHEPLVQGFVRFVYKVAVAILLLSYAFSGAKEHH